MEHLSMFSMISFSLVSVIFFCHLCSEISSVSLSDATGTLPKIPDTRTAISEELPSAFSQKLEKSFLSLLKLSNPPVNREKRHESNFPEYLKELVHWITYDDDNISENHFSNTRDENLVVGLTPF